MSIITESLLLNKQDDFSSIISEHNTNMNESYFFSALEFLAESKQQLRENSKVLYKTILESNNNTEVIHEAFSDFTAKAKQIIDKFIEFIKSVFARFITFLNSIVKSDKYLLKHEKDFGNFKSHHEFDFDGHVFTIDPSIPKANMVQAAWNQHFIELQFSKDDMTDDEIAKYLDETYSRLCNELENTYYDTFRAAVLGLTGSITSDDYASELFAIYRNNDSDKERITVDQSYVSKAYQRFKGYEKAQKEAKRTQTDLEKEYKELKNSINGLISKSDKKITATGTYKGATYDGFNVTLSYTDNKVIEKMDKFIKLKVEQVNQMSSIHLLAFTAKLDAMKDSFMQDKTVLYKALNNIQGLKKGDK